MAISNFVSGNPGGTGKPISNPARTPLRIFVLLQYSGEILLLTDSQWGALQNMVEYVASSWMVAKIAAIFDFNQNLRIYQKEAKFQKFSC